MADGDPIPGKDGGRAENVPSRRLPQSNRQQHPEAKQLSAPATHCGRVRYLVWLFGVRNRLSPTVRCVQRFPGLLPTMKTIVPVGRRPCGQNREGFPARPTPPAANPDPIMPLVVRLLAPPAVTDDGPVAAYRTPSWQQSQRKWDHPGSVLFSASGNAIKRIKAGVKARPGTPRQRLDPVAGLHPPVIVSVERKKRIPLSDCWRSLSLKQQHWPVY